MSRLAFCPSCQRPVQPQRKYGVGFWVALVLTSGFWLLTIPFKRKRKCPICKCMV